MSEAMDAELLQALRMSLMDAAGTFAADDLPTDDMLKAAAVESRMTAGGGGGDGGLSVGTGSVGTGAPGTFSFEWKIDDEATLKEMKAAAYKQQFKSSIFSAFGVRWYLQVHPNGHTEEGYVDVYLNLPSFPPKITAIEISQTLQCLETGSKHERTATYNKSMGAGWSRRVLSKPEIEFCASLTFTIKIELIAVYDAHGEDVTEAYAKKHAQLASGNSLATVPTKYEFPWVLSDAAFVEKFKTAPFGEKFKSPMFSACGFRWCLEAYPNGRDRAGNFDFYLQLLSLPPKIKSVNVSFVLQCLQTQTKHTSSHEYERSYGVGWRDSTLATAEIQPFDELTFGAKLELIAVYDQEGDDITEWHLQGKGKPKQDRDESKQQQVASDQDTAAKLQALFGGGSQAGGAAGRSGGGGQSDPLMAARLDSLSMNMERMTQKMATIESKLNAEEKEKDKGRVTQAQFEGLQQKVIAMERTMRQLMMKDMDPEELKFKAWLDSIDGLAAYYDLMVARGVINFDKLAVLSMQDIQNMGIDNIQHVMMILNKVLELNRNNGQNEGGIARGNNEGPGNDNGNTPLH